MIFNPNVMAAAGGGGGAVIGTYTGNGSATKQLTFDFEPAVVFLIRNGTQKFVSLILNSVGRVFLVNSSSTFDGAAINGKVLTITASAYKGYFNEKNEPFVYIAIPKA
jgi:hypothetical protein